MILAPAISGNRERLPGLTNRYYLLSAFSFVGATVSLVVLMSNFVAGCGA